MRGLERGLLLGALSLAGCGSDAPTDEPLREPSLLELDLTSPLSERPSSLFSEHEPNLWQALAKVRGLAKEPNAAGLFLRLGPAAGHLGDLDDWSAAVLALRAKGRPVHCHFDGIDNAGYALAAYCDRITMSPPGLLELVGLALESLHAKELLSSVGVEAQLLQIGKYKGAAEPFTQDSMSEPEREGLNALLDELSGAFRAHIVEGRKLSAEALAAKIDGGPYSSSAALAAGLVDHVAYDDEGRRVAKEAARATRVVKLFAREEKAGFDLKDLLHAFSGEEEKPPRNTPRLALVTLSGEIIDGDRASPNVTASGPFVTALRRLADDADVRAVVLRIESPGGSALASDLMWHAVRRVVARKPVIVSLGDVAASGGYYVASAGTRIVGSPGSLIGSIGVVGGKVAFGGTAEKLGVHTELLRRGAHAGWLSPLNPFSEVERARMAELLEDTYGRFIARIAEGRKLAPEQVERAAQGRVMGGKTAASLHLIDELGGLHHAVTLARREGRLSGDAPIERWPKHSDAFGALSSALGGAALPGFEAVRSLAAELPYSLPLLEAIAAGRPLAVMPVHLRVR